MTDDLVLGDEYDAPEPGKCRWCGKRWQAGDALRTWDGEPMHSRCAYHVDQMSLAPQFRDSWTEDI